MHAAHLQVRETLSLWGASAEEGRVARREKLASAAAARAAEKRSKSKGRGKKGRSSRGRKGKRGGGYSSSGSASEAEEEEVEPDCVATFRVVVVAEDQSTRAYVLHVHIEPPPKLPSMPPVVGSMASGVASWNLKWWHC